MTHRLVCVVTQESILTVSRRSSGVQGQVKLVAEAVEVIQVHELALPEFVLAIIAGFGVNVAHLVQGNQLIFNEFPDVGRGLRRLWLKVIVVEIVAMLVQCI